jgi:hypothetical protein
MSVICNHNAGFFSCCTVKFQQIIYYINDNLKFPDLVDSSQQFNWYKECLNEDITFNYFEHYDNINEIINKKISVSYENVIHEDYQYYVYQSLDFDCVKPIITKYFSPSKNILNIIQNMEKKYNIDYNNICVLFYRGNDKNRETSICDYSEYLIYANKI